MPLQANSQEILDKYGSYVRSLAATVKKQFNYQLDMNELVSYGNLGLLEAAERYDIKMGANFLTFAHYRIKGAIFDGLRKMGVLKGSAAERANAYLANLSEVDPAGVGRSIEEEVKDVASAVSGLAILYAATADQADGNQVASEELPADERLELEQLKMRVRMAIDQLPEKERTLLEVYYFQGKTLEEAGAEIGQSKSWASRLHSRAVEKLKKLLEKDADNFLEIENSSSKTSPRRSPNVSTPITHDFDTSDG